jgi:uncharacterized secreted protein with C-terminal beta-propeller domain
MTADRTPPARRPKLAAAVLIAFVAGAGALVLPAAAPAAKRPAAKPSALPAFPSCASLLSYARTNARRTGGRTGVPTRAGVLMPLLLDAPPPSVAIDGVAPSAPTSVPGTSAQASPAPSAAVKEAVPEFSHTNAQEAGVDEPDIVKTDGRTVFAIANGKLFAVDVTGPDPKLVGTLDLADGYGHQLLIRGDRLLVMSNAYGGGSFSGDVIISSSKVVISEVDISNPAAMTVRRTMSLEGALVDARLTGGTARVVVSASPDYIQPAAISRTSLRSFVPRTVLKSNLSGKTFRRSVVSCDDVRHPRRFSGLDLLTVLTIDLDKGLFNVDRDAIMAGAQTVYASTTGLYVASQRYVPALEAGRVVPDRSRTDIHRFDISKPDQTSFAASGSVAGFVLNQYSLSEFDGALRVASTEDPVWFDGAIAKDSESYVSVLAEHGRSLDLVGRADGLGHGERIYAVRFVGDKGYVVTFRQIDPLYTLDLSKKTDPRVVGELKILGYSAYLHPISDDLLLGVGQDATAQGRTTGTQLSLFDVSDPRKPSRKAGVSLENASSDAEFDPHAFLFWKPANLAVVPLSVYGREGQEFDGAVGFKIGSASVTEAGRITHPVLSQDGSTPPIGRSVVIGDLLYTLSYAGLASNRLDTLAPQSFATFPQPPPPPPDRPIPLPTPIP